MSLKYPRLSGDVGPHPQVGLSRVLLPKEVWHHPHEALDSYGDELGQYGRRGSSLGQKDRGCKLHCTPDAQSPQACFILMIKTKAIVMT